MPRAKTYKNQMTGRRGIALAGNFERHGNIQAPWVKKIPIDANLSAGENDTGYDLPEGALVIPSLIAIGVETAEAVTLDVGTATSESGDPDGFIAALSVSTTGTKRPTMANGAITLGALLRVLTTGGSVPVPEPHIVVSGTQSVVVGVTGGATATTTFRGAIYLGFLDPWPG